jgi:hypothetical protein
MVAVSANRQDSLIIFEAVRLGDKWCDRPYVFTSDTYFHPAFIFSIASVSLAISAYFAP